MPSWRPQLYLKRGRDQGIDETVLEHAISAGEAVIAVDPALPPVFSLKHLSVLCGADYGLFRAIVSRSRQDPYKHFQIRKRSSYDGEKRYRQICVPDPGLMKAQRWITQNILARGRPHFASVAFSKGDTVMAAAEPHCGCRWLIKLDVRNFFESINEISVYRVFRSFGYQPLVAFEMARICTRLGSPNWRRVTKRWQSIMNDLSDHRISAYRNLRMGHLPQGAPTSPMLANLAVKEFDSMVTSIARQEGLIYTRYADDITLSTRSRKFDRGRARSVIGQVYAAMGKKGLSPNVTKTRVAPPGRGKSSWGFWWMGWNQDSTVTSKPTYDGIYII